MPGVSRRRFLTIPTLGFALPAAVPLNPANPIGSSIAFDQAWLKLEPLSRWDAQLGFALEPRITQWMASGARSRHHASFYAGGYQLKLDFASPEPGLVSFQFRLAREDGQPFTVHRYSLKARLPFSGIYRFWDYRSGSPEIEAEFDAYTRGLASGEKYTQTYAANTGIPFVLCTNRNGENRFSFGMLDQVEVTGLHVEPYSLGLSWRGEGLNFSFEFVKPLGYSLKQSELVDGAWFDARPLNWFQTIREYSRWAERAANLRVMKPPPAAFEPIWNTWYPFGFNINQEIVLRNAEFCRQIGLRNLLIDAGYQNPLTGGLAAAEWNQFVDYTGDWTPNPQKFPDFRKMVELLHRQQQFVTVWVALFMLGKKTKAYREARGMLRRDTSGKEQSYLCPCHTETPQYLARTFLKLAKDYDLDGFWLDFMDNMHAPCYSSHLHFTNSPGEGYNRCLAAVRDAAMEYKPDFLMETRMRMANVNAKQFVNVMETSDMPFDFDLNRSMGVMVRSFSEGVASKLDPIQWHIRESEENVAVCCATVTLTGIPVFGVDLRLLPESHLRIIKAWMRFYRQHQDVLSRGELEPCGFASLFPQLQVREGRKAFLYIGSSSTTPVSVEGARQIYIINASGRSRMVITLDGIAAGRWRMVVRNCRLEVVSTHDREVDAGAFALDQQIPEGGLVELHVRARNLGAKGRGDKPMIMAQPFNNHQETRSV
jgi:alpha-galactosidase